MIICSRSLKELYWVPDNDEQEEARMGRKERVVWRTEVCMCGVYYKAASTSRETPKGKQLSDKYYLLRVTGTDSDVMN